MKMVGLKFSLELIFESEYKKFALCNSISRAQRKNSISTLHATKCIPDFRNSTYDPGQNKVDLKTPSSHGNNSRICAKEVYSALGP